MALIDRVTPPLSHDEMRTATLAAIAEANKFGLTGLHDPGEPREVLDVFEELAKAGTFNLRVYAMISDDSAAIAHYFQRGPQSALYDSHLWIRSIKLYADGALGSRGAALLDPYTDDPKNVGLAQVDAGASHATSRRARSARLSGRDARDRRPRQPRRARCVRGRAQSRAHGRPSLSHRARADPRSRRRPALRAARRHSVDAGGPPDERHVLGADPARLRAHARRVRLALAARTPASSFRTAATFRSSA